MRLLLKRMNIIKKFVAPNKCLAHNNIVPMATVARVTKAIGTSLNKPEGEARDKKTAPLKDIKVSGALDLSQGAFFRPGSSSEHTPNLNENTRQGGGLEEVVENNVGKSTGPGAPGQVK